MLVAGEVVSYSYSYSYSIIRDLVRFRHISE